MDYKNTLLSNLESLLFDLLSEDTISPTEIHDTFTNAVKESYYYHKHHTARSYEMMTKLHSEEVPKTFTTTLEIDPITNEPYLTLPPGLLERLNWTEGTELILTLKDDTLHITRA